MLSDVKGDTTVDLEIDLIADLNDMDDDGYGWSVLSDARDPSRVTVGRALLAGNSQAIAVIRVVAVDDDGQVHFTIFPDPIDKVRHLLDHAPA